MSSLKYFHTCLLFMTVIRKRASDTTIHQTPDFSPSSELLYKYEPYFNSLVGSKDN